MPTHYKGKPDEVLALDTLIKMVRSMDAISGRCFPALLKEFGITESQFAVLETLMHLGPLPPGQICEKILKSGSNVTTVVDNLERDGLVRRERDAVDRRVQIVHLTAKGASVIEKAFPRHVGRLTEMFGTLTRDELRELGRLCKKLGTGVKEQVRSTP